MSRGGQLGDLHLGNLWERFERQWMEYVRGQKSEPEGTPAIDPPSSR